MKFQRVLALSLSILTLVAPVFAAQAASAVQQDSKDVKDQISNAYNQLASMNPNQYSAALTDLSDRLAANGHAMQASALRSLAAPQMQPVVLVRIKDMLDQKSENGLFLVLDILLGGAAYRDLYKDGGANSALYLLLVIFTLDGDTAASF